MTLREVSKRIGVSFVRIKQIQTDAVKKLITYQRKNKVRQIPGFNSYYEREITDLVADAYKNDEKKKTKALKKITEFKKINKTVAEKFGFRMVLDHPLSYDFIKKATGGADPESLIRVRPIPERVNAFKTFRTRS